MIFGPTETQRFLCQAAVFSSALLQLSFLTPAQQASLQDTCILFHLLKILFHFCVSAVFAALNASDCWEVSEQKPEFCYHCEQDQDLWGSGTKKDAVPLPVPPRRCKKSNTVICGFRRKKKQYKIYVSFAIWMRLISHLLKSKAHPSNCTEHRNETAVLV